MPYYVDEPVPFYDRRDVEFEGYFYIGAEIEFINAYYHRSSLCMDSLPVIHSWPQSFIRTYYALLERFHSATNAGLDLVAELDRIIENLDSDILARAIDDIDFGEFGFLDDTSLEPLLPGNSPEMLDNTINERMEMQTIPSVSVELPYDNLEPQNIVPQPLPVSVELPNNYVDPEIVVPPFPAAFLELPLHTTDEEPVFVPAESFPTDFNIDTFLNFPSDPLEFAHVNVPMDQIVPATGSDLDLEIDPFLDELFYELEGYEPYDHALMEE